jgi:hypothetical protein
MYDLFRGDLFRHYKTGGEYVFLHVSTNTESGVKSVNYLSLNAPEVHGVWDRPLDMFLGQVMVEGRMVPRFERIGTVPEKVVNHLLVRVVPSRNGTA